MTPRPPRTPAQDRLEDHGHQLLADDIDLGCDCDVVFWFARSATDESEVHVTHEGDCRFLDLIARLN
jgi:hypothetical protein